VNVILKWLALPIRESSSLNFGPETCYIDVYRRFPQSIQKFTEYAFYISFIVGLPINHENHAVLYSLNY
jgi:hypothetical protein